MARINLLPWREQLRKERQKQFLVMLGSVIGVAAALVVYAHFHVSGMIDNQNARNRYLEQELKTLDKQLEEIKELESTKASLLARMNIIQQLQRSRPQVVHLFDELVTTLPEGVYITDVKQSGNALVVNGIAQSNARVSAYMRNIEASEWLTNPRLDVIETKQVDGVRRSDFVLRADQVGMAMPEEEAAAAPGKPGQKPKPGSKKK